MKLMCIVSAIILINHFYDVLIHVLKLSSLCAITTIK